MLATIVRGGHLKDSRGTHAINGRLEFDIVSLEPDVVLLELDIVPLELDIVPVELDVVSFERRDAPI